MAAEHITAITVSIDVDTNKQSFSAVCGSFHNAVEEYFNIMESIDGQRYQDWPLFKDEVQQTDYDNARVDTCCKLMIEKAENDTGGVFVSDEMTIITNRMWALRKIKEKMAEWANKQLPRNEAETVLQFLKELGEITTKVK